MKHTLFKPFTFDLSNELSPYKATIFGLLQDPCLFYNLAVPYPRADLLPSRYTMRYLLKEINLR